MTANAVSSSASPDVMRLCLDDSNVEATHRFYKRLGLDFVLKGTPTRVSSLLGNVTLHTRRSISSVTDLTQEDRFFIGVTVHFPRAPEGRTSGLFDESEADRVPVTKSGIVTFRDPDGILVRLFSKNCT